MPDPNTISDSNNESDPNDDADADERAARIERALLENQQLEREEAEADLKRQQQIDDAIIKTLASRETDPDTDEPTT
jgi:hypothetical protein